MEYILFAGFAVAFLLFLFLQGMYQEKKERRWFMQRLRDQYGKEPDREYKPERYVRIPGYYENHSRDNQIDDITWNDLKLDDIFQRMNYTLSSTGEEYLYYRLRTPEFDEKALVHFHEIAEYFDQNEEDRISFQMLMRKLGTTGKFSLYDYIEYLTKFDALSNKKEYLMLGLLAAGIMLMFFNLTGGILAVIGVIFYQMLSYYKIRKEIEPYITSLAYMIRLSEIADKVQKLKLPVCEEEGEQIRQHVRNLQRTKRGSYWVFHDPKNSSGGNPLDAVLVYVTMIFHVDLIAFNKMLGELKSKITEIDALVSILGYLETAVCVTLYRASVKGEYCVPQFGGEELVLKEGYHPMLHDPVKNSIYAPRSILLTGSNASGKSTFLKMTSLNVLMAQTMYTVCADEYRAPFYRIYSSMSLRDDLENGESYYIVEIKAIKRIMEHAAEQMVPKVICFVDEVLRGTNTTERIAASSQILKSFAENGVLCFAATHDLELTELLKNHFDNYHFEESVTENDILFNYKLQTGKAATKNAIRLLQLMGYAESIIESANEQAAYFEENGAWKLT